MEIIDRYDRLPLGKYMDIVRIVQSEKTDEIDKQVGIISVLSGMSKEDILNLDLGTFSGLSLRTSFLNKEAKASSVASFYNLGGLELVRVKDFRTLTAGQYIDFQIYCKNKADIKDILSVLLIPRGHRYNDGYDMDKVRHAIWRYLPLPDALAIQDFFFRSSRELINNSLTSWGEVVKKMPRAKRKEMTKQIEGMMASLQDGGGFDLSTLSARRCGRTGTKSLRCRLWSSFKSLLIGKKRTHTS